MKDKEYKKWDTHHHIVPDFYVEEMKNMGMTEFNTLKWPKWSPEISIKMMDKFLIEKAFVSISAPGTYFKDVEYSDKLSRKCNEFIAKMISDYPGRFGGFASVALPDVESALREMEYAFDTLNLDGINLMSNVNGIYFGDESYLEFFDALDKRNAIIYVHPNEIPTKEDHQFLNPLYLWQNDTTRTIIEFVKSGYHRKYPNIKWILSHGGGVLAPLYGTIVESMKRINPNIEAELEEWKSQIFLDTASKAFEEQIPMLLSFSDMKHVIFGSDIGWANKMAASTIIKSYSKLDEKYEISKEEIEDVFMGNAKRLFSQDRVEIDTERKFKHRVLDLISMVETGNTKYHYHCMPEKVVEILRVLDPSLELEDIKSWDEDDTLKWMEENNYDKVFLSLDLPELWEMNPKDILTVLRIYNEEVSIIRNKNAEYFGAFGLVDIRQSHSAVQEIDYCLEQLKLDGIALSTNMDETKFGEFIDEKILKKLSTLEVPVMIHPRDTRGLPLINNNYLDSIYFLAKAMYLGYYDKYLKNVKLVLTHTDNVLPYVAQPFNILFYMTVKKPRVWLYLLDNMILKNPKGYKEIMKMITD